MNTIYQIVFVIVIAGFFIFSNVLAGHWAKTGQQWLWIPIFLSACIGYMLFGALVKQTNLSISAGLVDALIVIVSIAIGIFILKDAVTTKQMIGLAFACLAVLFVL